MQIVVPTHNTPFSLLIGIKTKKNESITLSAHNTHDTPTYFVSRKGDVNGYREFELKFPQVPETLVVNIYNTRNGNYQNDEDNSFSVEKIEAKDLKTTPIWLSAKDKSFIEFAKFFCQNASYLSASQFVNGKELPSVYASDDGVFKISYYDKIRDRKTKRPLNTPARIGHITGNIEVSKSDFLRYSVPMRMIILLHEYSHKWKNPEDGNHVGYESGADINALLMYLSLGYSEMEAHQAFLYVFKGANSEGNHKRYLIIRDFIRKFNNGELKKYIKNVA